MPLDQLNCRDLGPYLHKDGPIRDPGRTSVYISQLHSGSLEALSLSTEDTVPQLS